MYVSLRISDSLLVAVLFTRGWVVSSLAVAASCTVDAVVSADSPLTFIAVGGSLALSSDSGHVYPAPAAAPAVLSASVNLADFADSACGGCLRDVVLEFDVEVRGRLCFCCYRLIGDWASGNRAAVGRCRI